MSDLAAIDWGWAGSNAIWVVGLAVAVAALSWRAGAPGESRAGPFLTLGLLLTGVGLIACRDFLPERALYGLACLAVVLQAAVAGARRANADG